MKNDIIETIEIPQGTDAILEGGSLTLKKGSSEAKKKFKISNVEVNIRKEGGKIILEAKKATRNESKIINTIRAHINNMILGMDKKYVYKLKVCSVHFPIGVSKEANFIVVKNFLGEEKPRRAEILKNAEVRIEKDIITIESPDKEAAGQTAANIENATRVRAKDRRVFQDGIFMTEKCGKEI
ncbi:50S ribosomal protein L6 [Candidatus Pacearchaeota archaeon]|nr:50S ribosomal protein L6 [Candidatus Pacearchaeota archaeon]